MLVRIHGFANHAGLAAFTPLHFLRIRVIIADSRKRRFETFARSR